MRNVKSTVAISTIIVNGVYGHYSVVDACRDFCARQLGSKLRILTATSAIAKTVY